MRPRGDTTPQICNPRTSRAHPVFLDRPDARLSWLDFERPGRLRLCLHGHFGRGRNFAPLAASLSGRDRVIALDQRGHGWSSHPENCSRAALDSILDHLMPDTPVHMPGHSLGGLNADGPGVATAI